ncbi:ATP-binding protein [Planosporangium thailandense]|nr:ATP-binding protein [Planosporangium thailandense]
MVCRLALRLPRDASTVPLVRHMLAQMLSTLGVADDCCDDLVLILTEACGNVVQHASDTDVYEVSAELRDSHCVIAVADTGTADPIPFLSPSIPPPLADRGRGLHIIRSLADEVELAAVEGGGLALRAVVALRWPPNLSRSN